MANILDGKKIAAKIRNKIKNKIAKYEPNLKRRPCLAVILIGDDSASHVYVKNKDKACSEVGILTKMINLDNSIIIDELKKIIRKLNKDPKVDGILVQLPLPKHLNVTEILEEIAVNKDVDGFHPFNLGRLAQGIPNFKPCTAASVELLLKETKVKLKGLHAVVIGTSNIVGKPAILQLINQGVTVTSCDINTVNLQEQVQSADILISGCGQAKLIKSSWLKDNAIVIDIGINRTKEGFLVGDVDAKEALDRISWYTPVPGGVGPITVAMLLENTLKSYLLASN